jgi:hypothetical protein
MYLNVLSNSPGYWDPITSTIDWCEPNYKHHGSIAEMYNTFSNVAYMIAGLGFLYNAHRTFTTNNFTREVRLFRFYFTGIALILVGVGSFLFHMTLRRDHQAMDELAMYIAVLTLLYALLNVHDEFDEQGRKKSFLYFFPSVRGAITWVICANAFAFAVYVYDHMAPVVFQTSFGIAILVSVFKSAYMVHTVGKNLSGNTFVRQSRADCTTMLHAVTVCAIAGFCAWLTDNTYCPLYEHLKLHSLWHLFTAMGCYLWAIFLLQTHYLNLYVNSVSGQNTSKEAVRTKISWLPFPHVNVIDVVAKSDHEDSCGYQ